MIKRVIFGFMFAFLVLALVLYNQFGVRYPFSFGDNFRSILGASMAEFSKVKHFEIKIPTIPITPATGDLLSAVFNIANFLSSIVNLFLSIFNAFVEIITFLVCIIHAVEDFGAAVTPIVGLVV